MSSVTSPVRAVLEGYVAGRVTAERVVAAVAAAYYGEGGQGKGEGLKPLMEIIERAHPGVIELSGTAEKPGFGVRLAERPFPREYEAGFREAVQAVLGRHVPDARTRPPSPFPRPGLLSRLYTAVRRFFTASA
jgi:hypothetical protein